MKTRLLFSILPAVLSVCTVVAAGHDTVVPSQITTRDGKVYSGVERVRADPDGIVVDYKPSPGGIGLAKLKFRDLPDDLQKKYKYDEKKSAAYETRETQETGKMLQTRTAEEIAVVRFRNLAELNRSLAGDQSVSYSTTLDANNAITLQGVTQTYTNMLISPVGYPISYPTVNAPNYPPLNNIPVELRE